MIARKELLDAKNNEDFLCTYTGSNYLYITIVEGNSTARIRLKLKGINKLSDELFKAKFKLKGESVDE